jgi:hypothetical protein
MKRCTGNNLCVIDNINHSDFEALKHMKAVFERTGWKFLITSRAVPDDFEALDVDELDLEDAEMLFCFHYFDDEKVLSGSSTERCVRLRDKLESTGIKKDLDALLIHILRHTLLTELLAKAGNKKRLSPAQLKARLIEQDYSHRDLQRTISTGRHGKSTHRLNTQTLHNYLLDLFETDYLVTKTGNDKDDGEHAAKATMLRFFSVLPSTDIPIVDLKRLWRVEFGDENSFEDRLDELKQIGWISGKQAFIPAKALLQDQAYKMHPLVQDVVYKKLRPDIDNCRPLVKTVSEIMKHALPEPQAYQNYAKSIRVKLKLLSK